MVMGHNPFAPTYEDLPQAIPVFPLTGVLLLPTGNLPLNIFEQRYLDMVNDALAGSRLIGMIQPSGDGDKGLRSTGCAGKITDFSESEDGRYLISLTGICRFKVQEEISATTAYRQVSPDWSDFRNDLKGDDGFDLDRPKLKEMLKSYFDMQDMDCEWEQIEKAPEKKLITCLSMICPFEPHEKQALLEAENSQARSDLFMKLLDFAVKSSSAPGNTDTHH